MSILGQPIPISGFQGTRQIPARSIPQSLNALKVSFDGSTISSPATHVILTIDYSPDGALWATEAVSEANKAACVPFPIVWEFTGGMTDRAGNPLVDLFVETGPFPDGAARQVRGTLVVTGAPLTTTATISAEQITAQAKLK